MAKFKLISSFVLAIIVIVILVQNTASVDTRLLFFKLPIPLALLILLSTLIGFALGVLVSLIVSGSRKPADK